MSSPFLLVVKSKVYQYVKAKYKAYISYLNWLLWSWHLRSEERSCWRTGWSCLGFLGFGRSRFGARLFLGRGVWIRFCGICQELWMSFHFWGFGWDWRKKCCMIEVRNLWCWRLRCVCFQDFDCLDFWLILKKLFCWHLLRSSIKDASYSTFT